MSSTPTQPAKKTARRQPIPTKAQLAKKAVPKAAVPKEQAKPDPKPEASKPEPKTLVEALSTGQTVLLKVRANGTRRSLPYLAVGAEGRKQAEAVAQMRKDGQNVDDIAEALKVSTATARRFITNLTLAHEVEAGDHDAAWKPGAKEVVVHTVAANQAKA